MAKPIAVQLKIGILVEAEPPCRHISNMIHDINRIDTSETSIPTRTRIGALNKPQNFRQSL
jgi:hypothetical protein